MANNSLLKWMTDRPLLAALLLASVIVAGISLLRATGYLQLLELTGFDLLLTSASHPDSDSPPVVLIGITEEEIQSLGRWPLTDEMLKNTIEQILSYKPRVLGVDIYRDQQVPPGAAGLNTLLAATDNVVLIHKLGGPASPSIKAPAVLQETNRIGFSDMVIDPGGAVRRGLLFMDDGQQSYSSLALAMVLKYLQADGIYPQAGVPEPSHIRLGKVTIPPLESHDGAYIDADAGGYQFMLNFKGGPAPFRQLALADLQDRETAARFIHDRIVILGVTAESVKDSFVTPYNQSNPDAQAMSGIVLHGHIANQLIRMAVHGEQPIKVPEEYSEYMLIAAWGLLGAVVAVYVQMLWQFLLLLVAGLLIIVGVPYMALQSGWWIPMVPAVMAWILSAGLVLVFLRGQERSQRKQLMDLFSRNVSADIAEEIWRQRDHFLEGGRLAASEITATVLFSDLENFTPLSEKLGPSRLMDWLNRYMEIMAGLVITHGGIVDDYYGDAIMADFGVPLVRETDEEITLDARSAVDCALAMRQAIDELNAECEEQGLPAVRMRVGICTGAMVAGFLGNKERMKYTTIGDTVNTAARLESYGKELPAMEIREGACRILVGESTAQRLSVDYLVEAVGDLELKGKAKPVAVYKVIARNAQQKDKER